MRAGERGREGGREGRKKGWRQDGTFVRTGSGKGQDIHVRIVCLYNLSCSTFEYGCGIVTFLTILYQAHRKHVSNQGVWSRDMWWVWLKIYNQSLKRAPHNLSLPKLTLNFLHIKV